MNPFNSEVRELEAKLEAARGKAAQFERACSHNWGPTEADHIVTPGYQDPGDAPGTMGVDWRGPVYVNGKTEKRWKRTCQKCGKVEHTSKTTETVTVNPRF